MKVLVLNKTGKCTLMEGTVLRSDIIFKIRKEAKACFYVKDCVFMLASHALSRMSCQNAAFLIIRSAVQCCTSFK